MELIINSPKYGQFTVLYDDEDHDKIKNYNWHVEKRSKGSSLIYAASKVYKNGRQSTLYMHRLITNCPDNKIVDHINHDTLDNRKCNLRVCSNQENSMNRKSNKNSSSRFKGVCWKKREKKWISQINANNKNTCLGYFENEIDAAIAYNVSAKCLFGEFAHLNEVL
jgi:hypothetical protein